MNDAIVFEYNPFDYGSIRSRVIKDGKSDPVQVYNTLNINEAADLIISLTYNTNIYKCEFLCPTSYYDELQKLVHEAETQKYSTNKIVMELL